MVDLATTALGMAATIGATLVLIPRFGLVGAALAFALGAGVRLAAAALYTLAALRRVTAKVEKEQT